MSSADLPTDTTAQWPSWRRSLAAGLLWLEVLWIIDTLDSFWLLQGSTEHIKADATTRDLLIGAVIDFMARIQAAYLILALLAAVAVRLAMGIVYPLPVPRKRWWRTMIGSGAVATLLAYLHQARAFPPLHDWMMFFLPFWADNGEFWMVYAAAAGLAGWALWRAAPRWRGLAGGLPQMGRRTLALAAFLVAAALLLRPPAARHPADNAGQPNVVLIGLDALRPDRLGGQGHSRDTAPHLDALLAESVVFTQAFTSLPRTYPSWTSILSGDWPTTHGVRDNLPTPERLVPDQALLPQVLGGAGYATAFATDDSRFSYMVPETGFSRIFQPPVSLQNFAISVNEPRYRAFHGLMHNRVGFGLVPVTAYNQAFGKSYRPWLFNDRAADVLADVAAEGPFLYAVHSCVLHAPGDRIDPWFRMFDQRGYRGKNRFRYSRSGTEHLTSDDDGTLTNAKAEQDEKIYDSGIRMADDLVARVVAELKGSGLWDNTIVVVFSDHGENLWAPDLPYRFQGPNHGFHPYDDGQNRVLLGIRFPDGSHAGTRVDQPVRLIDIAPTLADLLGITWPEPQDGASVMPLVRGEVEPQPRLVYIETGLSESNYWPKNHRDYPFRKVSERYGLDPETGRVHIKPEFLPHLIAAKDRAVQRGRWKLVWRAMIGDPLVQLYDREADPHNRDDVSRRYPLETAQLGLDLRPFLEHDGESSPLFAEWERIVALPEPPAPAPSGPP